MEKHSVLFLKTMAVEVSKTSGPCLVGFVVYLCLTEQLQRRCGLTGTWGMAAWHGKPTTLSIETEA